MSNNHSNNINNISSNNINSEPTPLVNPSSIQSSYTRSLSSLSSSSNMHHSNTSLPSAIGHRCLNPASDINSHFDAQVEVKVYPCNNNSNNQNGNNKKKHTTFNVKPEGVVIQGVNRNRNAKINNNFDLGLEYSKYIGRNIQRYELADTRAAACGTQLLVTSHKNKSFYVVPAPESSNVTSSSSRHSGICQLLGDRKNTNMPSHTLQVGDFLRVGSVGIVIIETHDGTTNHILSEEKIQKIMKDTTSNTSNNNNIGDGTDEDLDDDDDGFGDIEGPGETDGENSDDDSLDDEGQPVRRKKSVPPGVDGGAPSEPLCYMCFDGEEDSEDNPLITPCKCKGDTQYVHVECLRKWHTAEADNQICFLSSVDATCSVCKSSFCADFKLKDGRLMKLFKSSLEPPYVSMLVVTKHEMAQRLFNTRFQLSFSTLLKPDGQNSTRPLTLGRSSGSDMVLDYRTVSARHANIKLKNGSFVFTDTGSSNGSYLYVRRPIELQPSQTIQFRVGRSMISMKVVRKWNRRLLKAVRDRTGGGSSNSLLSNSHGSQHGGDDDNDLDDRSIGSNNDDVRIITEVAATTGGSTTTPPTTGSTTQQQTRLNRRSRESVIESLPQPGELSQQSSQHLDLLYALAYPSKQPATTTSNNNITGMGSCGTSSISMAK